MEAEKKKLSENLKCLEVTFGGTCMALEEAAGERLNKTKKNVTEYQTKGIFVM